MKHYSVDLRERLLLAIDAGLSRAEASSIFGVGIRSLTCWQRQRRDTGQVTPKPRPGRTPTIGPAQADELRAQVAQSPDATLAEHCASWRQRHGVAVSVMTMSRAIRRLGITVQQSPPRHRAGPGSADRLA